MVHLFLAVIIYWILTAIKVSWYLQDLFILGKLERDGVVKYWNMFVILLHYSDEIRGGGQDKSGIFLPELFSNEHCRCYSIYLMNAKYFLKCKLEKIREGLFFNFLNILGEQPFPSWESECPEDVIPNWSTNHCDSWCSWLLWKNFCFLVSEIHVWEKSCPENQWKEH